ncbi:hypothetical protein D1AOALGA4SA_9374 [Olavius algarvensis Delta 1 endosymbiont]|nr:hypothetical protein D1AOALGA4SA_9374 [Olavius algarvensis Delta 1 endosymbiont]
MFDILRFALNVVSQERYLWPRASCLVRDKKLMNVEPTGGGL